MIDIFMHDNAIIVAKVIIFGQAAYILHSMFDDIENSDKAGVVISIILTPIYLWTAWII